MPQFKKALAFAVAAVLLLSGSVFGGARPAGPPAETTLLATAVQPSTLLASLPADFIALRAVAAPPVATTGPAPAEPVLISPGKPSVLTEPILISPARPSVSAGPASLSLAGPTVFASLAATPPGPAVDLARLQRPFRDRLAPPRAEAALFDANLIFLAAVNVADYFSTREALKYPGLHECNPLMKPFVGNKAAFAAIKAGSIVLNHVALKRLHKRNPTAAWLLTTASNVVISYVVVNNMRLIREARVR